MEEQIEEAAPCDSLEPYVKVCTTCSKVVFVNIPTCPKCMGAEFEPLHIRLEETSFESE